jgi:hypothetical protein
MPCWSWMERLLQWRALSGGLARRTRKRWAGANAGHAAVNVVRRELEVLSQEGKAEMDENGQRLDFIELMAQRPGICAWGGCRLSTPGQR